MTKTLADLLTDQDREAIEIATRLTALGGNKIVLALEKVFCFAKLMQETESAEKSNYLFHKIREIGEKI